jgi:hypothetical protein
MAGGAVGSRFFDTINPRLVNEMEDDADALRHSSLEAASLILLSGLGPGRNLIAERYEGGHGLLLFTLGHLVIFKGTPELRRDLVELIRFDVELGMGITQLLTCIFKRPA